MSDHMTDDDLGGAFVRDAIVTVREWAEVQTKLDITMAALVQSRREVAALREALAPFAAIDLDNDALDFADVEVTVAQIRAAKTAMFRQAGS